MVIGLVVLALAACSDEKSVTEDLKSIKWNVVETDGDGYTLEFGETTATFTTMGFPIGRTYEIDGNVITFTDEKGSYVYDIEKNGEDYIFKAQDEADPVDLTLSPAK